MKKILLLSDTHGYIDNQILNHVKNADEVWHAGDIGDIQVTDSISELKPMRAVHGNIDGAQIRSVFPADARFNCEGMDVWITHIGGYPGRYDRRVKDRIRTNPPQLFVCGHSHILKVMHDKTLNLLHINPGAIGKYGFHTVRTMVRFEIAQGQIQNLEIIEIKRS